MFRNMRRKKQLLSNEECIRILTEGTSGVLALSGDNGYPYALPISYVYDKGKLLFHSAVNGHKINAIAENNKCSFCVISRDDIFPEKYTTRYQSVIAFGRIQILSNEAEKRKAIEKLAKKYAPDNSPEHLNQEITDTWNSFYMLELTIEHMTGKEGLELVKERNNTIEGMDG